MNTKQLRQKILDLAIRGKLVPQDPNDEPASVLLERIQAEKEQLIKEGKIKRSKKDSTISQSDDKLHYEQLPFDLPNGWTKVKLGSIGNWQSGSTPSRQNPAYYGGSIPWLKTGDLNDGLIGYIPEAITDLALQETSVKLNPAGSVLIAMYGATIGKLGILTYPATTNQACCACSEFVGVDSLYLFYFLLQHRNEFISKGEGGAQPNISKEKIVNTLIPLPPIAEQHRIAIAIETAFITIDEIERNKDELKNTISMAKSKILSLAIQGKLVSQDPNDETASVLLERIRSEKELLIKAGKIKRSKNDSAIIRGDDNCYYDDFPTSWEYCRLDEVLHYEQPTQYIVESTDYNNEYETPVLTAGKSFVIGYTNETNGICSNLPVIIFDDFTTDSKFVNFPFKVKSSAMKILWTKHANLKYLFYLMQTIECNHTTHKRYWISDYSQNCIMLPPLAEQHRIVVAIEATFEQLDNIAATLT